MSEDEAGLRAPDDTEARDEEEAFATRARAFFFELDRASNAGGYSPSIPLASPVSRVLPALVRRARDRAREVICGRPSPVFAPWDDAAMVKAAGQISAFMLALFAKHFPLSRGADPAGSRGDIDVVEAERADALFARGRLRKVQLATNGEPDSANLLLFAEIALLVIEHGESGLAADAARWRALLPGFVRAQEHFLVAYEPRAEERTWQTWGAGRGKIDPGAHPASTWIEVTARAEERYRRALAETGDDLAACRRIMGENAAYVLRDDPGVKGETLSST